MNLNDLNNMMFSSYKSLGEQMRRHPELFNHYAPESFNGTSPEKDWFRIFDDMQNIQPVAVLIGQDPYPQPKTATGIAFANFKREGEYKDLPLSPSLQVIKDSVLSFTRGGHFDETLMHWVKQGIMPINVSWTVKYNCPGSDMLYWTRYTSEFLNELSDNNPNLYYILFGTIAQAFRPSIIRGFVIQEYHPAYYVRKGMPMPTRIWKDLVDNVKENQGKELHLTYDEQ